MLTKTIDGRHTDFSATIGAHEPNKLPFRTTKLNKCVYAAVFSVNSDITAQSTRLVSRHL